MYNLGLYDPLNEFSPSYIPTVRFFGLEESEETWTYALMKKNSDSEYETSTAGLEITTEDDDSHDET